MIGELVGAAGFPSPNLFCKWGLVAGGAWRCLEGDTAGRTHVDHPADGATTCWMHPIGGTARLRAARCVLVDGLWRGVRRHW